MGDEELSEEERRALRGSKFAPLPSTSFRSQPRLAHPGGPMATNKAAALAKFLERKLQQPGGLDSLDPNLLELAVKNAKETFTASKGGASTSGVKVRHVDSFGESYEEIDEDQDSSEKLMKKKRKKKKKKKGKVQPVASAGESYEDCKDDENKLEPKKHKKKKRKVR